MTSKAALYLDCRTCVEQKIAPLRMRAGLTQDAQVEIECKRHGHVATLALDGSAANFAIELLAKGCESCRRGVVHVH